MSWIVTSRGEEFDFDTPDLAHIDIRDIAESLSKEVRFTGKCRGFYSVAEHSVLASVAGETYYGASPTLQLELLLHDASEAFVKDLSKPLKDLLPQYSEVEGRVAAAIRARFDLSPTPHPLVKEIDMRLLATERRDLMPKTSRPWIALPEYIQPFDFEIGDGWAWQRARKEFLTTYWYIKDRREQAA